jgi:ubiquitin related modifier 1
MRVKVELGGGLELLCGKQRQHTLDLTGTSMRHLVQQMCGSVIQERVELFAQGDSVRPGILVLINDVDWELCGGMDSVLTEGDEVVFISTLHGG